MADTYQDDLAGVYGAVGLLLIEVKKLTQAVEALHRDVRALFDEQRQKDEP